MSKQKDWYEVKDSYEIDKINCTLRALNLPGSDNGNSIEFAHNEDSCINENDVPIYQSIQEDDLEGGIPTSMMDEMGKQYSRSSLPVIDEIDSLPYSYGEFDKPTIDFLPLMNSDGQLDKPASYLSTVSPHTTSPLAFVMNEDSWANFNSTKDWVEIISKEVSCDVYAFFAIATLSFNWKDQGWGHQKGKLRVKLVKSKHDHEQIAQWTFETKAPHYFEDKLVERTIDNSHDIIQKCVKGNAYVIEGKVGEGGGHELYVKDLTFKIEHNKEEMMHSSYTDLELNVEHNEKLMQSSYENWLSDNQTT